MTALVSRTGRHQQRYHTGYRLVAGCIPYRYKEVDGCNGKEEPVLEVLMITSKSGRGLLFPKGGWETDETVEEAAVREALEEAGVRGDLQGDIGTWEFKSKRQQSDLNPAGLCRAHMFALEVREQLESWPEQHSRQREWFVVSEAVGQCQVDWMRKALDKWVSCLKIRQGATTSNQGQSFI
ncbi:hypothetical protein SELMODRAFT_73964 [Selaginella moellendorffii]|uniref:Nudix hydrolase domain-containing protein n=1 Tax=Selaginella moellendorffii TaxID=88036 RepID=D8QNW5_SELML|nr:nudix hydrolase 16, mitochondrial [Selaginella moellendorffii]XP_002983395.1 nudix hydrolase 16, mitochondrial [Selaginella moellendorffii]EFJ15737.1 hypothetical protein SELMODRAFT_118184 [Selaginella moellendorffii]EFJ38182.1 hypothetical protein SELMODRAFT_73964 [Selaginella moellendorffii]|eukprot:XP_002960643.1 nudix hydrolase 16, mitochondrial [Selaginella moellendorffii]